MVERFSVGAWEVHPELNEIVRGDTCVRIEPKVMQVLIFLAGHPGKVLTRQQILDSVWAGVFVVDEALTYAVTELRRALEDDAKNPRFIQTIPRRGYRLIAPVVFPQMEPALSHTSANTLPRRRRAWIVAGCSAAVLIAAVSLTLWLHRPAPRFAEGDSVLVARFENTTGEAVFDGTLDYWLSHDLAESRFVRVASRESVEDILRLMKKPREVAIDRTIGREVCLRDGGIRGLVAGRVEKVGTRYVVTVDLVDPATGETAGARREEAEGLDAVLPAVRRISEWLRMALGEKLPAMRSLGTVERVTTPSLRGAQLYTQADRLVRQGRRAAAAELLRQCVAEDPEFASAHILLAFCLRPHNDPGAYLPPAQRAVELSGRTSDRERYFILGGYYTLAGDDEKAAAAYEALLALHPDHNWGTNNLVFAYQRIGRLCERIASMARLAESVRPSNGSSQYFVAAAILGCEGDIDTAERFVARTSRSITQDDEMGYPWLRPFIDLFPAMKHLALGEPEPALARAAGADVEQRIGGEANLYAGVGRLRAAQSAAQGGDDLGSASVSLLKGDEQAVRESLRRLRADRPALSDPFDVMLLVRTGSLAEGRRRLELWKQTGFARGLAGKTLATIEGEIARVSGDRAEAVRLLREGLDRPSIDGGTRTYFLGAESLADLLETEGKTQEASEVLAKASVRKKSSAFRPFGFAFWLRNQHRLSQLERRLGRIEGAARIEAELRRLLVCADDDHPILVALRETQKQGTSQSSSDPSRP